MSKQKVKVNLYRIRDDPSSITPVLRTVNAAFASDPLIRWLRPDATPSVRPTESAWKWQYRRVQGVISKGMVLRSASVAQMASQYPRKRRNPQSEDFVKAAAESSAQVLVFKDSDCVSSEENAGAVAFLFPPKGHLEWSFGSIWLACKLWLLDLFSPVNDNQAKKKRVDQLFAANLACKKALQAKYSAQRLWYLEIIAVHPSLQSCGLGQAVMSSILEYTTDHPIYLECTRQDNIGFYESFGFRIVEEVELSDEAESGGDGKLKYWVMVRSIEG